MLLLAGIVLFSCKQKPGSSQQDENAGIIPLVSAPYFYTLLKGTMGDKPVTMQLLKTTPSVYRGYYSFDTSGQPITIWGTGDSGYIKLYEENIDPENERFFSGMLDDSGHLTGVWHGNGTSYHFNFHTDFKDAVPLVVYYATDSAYMIPGNTKSPLGLASTSILWPAKDIQPELSAFLKQVITGSNIQDPKQFMKRTIDSFITSYSTAGGTVDTAELLDPSSAGSWTWTTENDMKVVYNHWPLLVLEKYGYAYTGGAHGNWGSTFITIDAAKKKVLKPADVFKPGYKEAFSPLLDKAFREKYSIDGDEVLSQSLLTPTIVPNDNFIFTDKGVAFSYVPYEIGPYSLGQVTLYLPFTAIRQWIK